ncbi:MAG: hypothetical protein ACM65L_07760 [Microcoleus sp.]
MAELAADGRRVRVGVGVNVVVCSQGAGWSWCTANLRWSQKFGWDFWGTISGTQKSGSMRLTTVKVPVMRWTGI